jgi:hypothetical protein
MRPRRAAHRAGGENQAVVGRQGIDLRRVACVQQVSAQALAAQVGSCHMVGQRFDGGGRAGQIDDQDSSIKSMHHAYPISCGRQWSGCRRAHTIYRRNSVFQDMHGLFLRLLATVAGGKAARRTASLRTPANCAKSSISTTLSSRTTASSSGGWRRDWVLLLSARLRERSRGMRP